MHALLVLAATAPRLRRGRARAGLCCCAASSLPSSERSFLQPEVVRVPRARVNIKFAVLLLRSSYAAVDELDFVPTDAFQVAFWKRRAAEQEAYLGLYAPLQWTQGDLTDPLYFDYICFAQLLTIAQCMRRGEQVFQEATDADGTLRTVRRDPALRDNAALPEAYGRLVGDKLFVGLRDGFEEERFDGPAACASADFACALEGVRQLVRIFVARGYAFSGDVLDVDAPARRFRLRLGGAATLWATASLASRASSPPPEFLGFAICAFLRASGWAGASYTSRASSVALEQEWQLEAL
jgi:hypothetical protein